MRNSFLVVKHEIVTTLSKASFWLMALLFPLFILLATVVPSFWAEESMPPQPDFFAETAVTQLPIIGYVDEANLIASLPAAVPPDRLRAFSDEAAAQAALNAGEINEYYLIPPDYVATGRLSQVSQDFQLLNSGSSQRLIEYLLRLNLTGDEDLTALLLQPTAALQSHSLAETAVIEDSPGPASAAMAFTVPIAAMFIFFFLITMSSGYMLQSVSREKENRTVEVLLLSLEPRQLMLGKMIGLSVVALLQMAIWAGATLLIMQRDSGLLDLLRETGLSTGFFVWALIYLILGYLMYASLMGAIGALVPTAREGAQFTFFVLLPLFIPILFNYLFINAPDSPLAVGFSLFPLTAPIAMMTRMVTTTVPFWQLAASLLIQAVTAYLFVLLAAYFFRADTLLANTTLSWRRLLKSTTASQ